MGMIVKNGTLMLLATIWPVVAFVELYTKYVLTTFWLASNPTLCTKFRVIRAACACACTTEDSGPEGAHGERGRETGGKGVKRSGSAEMVARNPFAGSFRGKPSHERARAYRQSSC